MRALEIRLVARRHVDFKRVCSACCLPGSPR
ncbi:Ms4527A family Cys-rich leader peptide [Nocardia sp. NPDC004573]